jgi:glycosyltransferase involved in cell wall biosynthesis
MRIEPVSERYRPPVRDILWHQLIFPRLLRQGEFDVAHVPSYRRMVWSHPCGMVATIHDLAPFHVQKKYDPARMFYGRVVARQLARRQDEIIAVSRVTANEVQNRYGVPAEQVTTVHNGIDHRRFTPGSKSEARGRVCLPRGIRGPFFLYVARFEHPAKNHVRLIEAFNAFKARSCSPWQLVLGGTDWHGAGAIHAVIDASPFRSEIHRLGFVPAEELPDWYRAADLFVNPSLYEGFGLPPLEAMACGCPVLTTTRGALGEVVGEAAGKLDPERSEGIQEAMASLAASAPERERLRAAGLVQARRFDWNAAASATLAVYERACRRRSGQRAGFAVLQPVNP